MKRLLASLIAIGFLVGLTIWWRGYMHGVVEVMYKEIDEAIAALNEEDIHCGLGKIDDAKEQWEQSESVLTLFLSHDVTNGIDLNIERSRSYAERGGTIDALAELRAARHSLYDMERSLELSFRNIM